MKTVVPLVFSMIWAILTLISVFANDYVRATFYAVLWFGLYFMALAERQ